MVHVCPCTRHHPLRSIPRQPLYAALKVAEIWRWDGKRVVPLHRTRGGKYAVATRSLAFPALDLGLLNEAVQLALTHGQPAALKTLLRARLRGTSDLN